MIDLNRVRLLQMRKQYEAFHKLVKACQKTHTHRTEYFEKYLICLGEQKRWDTFDKEIDAIKSAQKSDQPESKNDQPESKSDLLESKSVQLALSIRYFQEAIFQYGENDQVRGLSCCKQALSIADDLSEKYPTNASVLSQRAHCLRLLGKPESEWRELFRRAHIIDPERMRQEKTDNWRKEEQEVLASLKHSPQ